MSDSLSGNSIVIFGLRVPFWAWPIITCSVSPDGKTAVPNAASIDGSAGGKIITDTTTVAGPVRAIKAQGGDVVIASGTLPSGWSGSLAGVTISNGDTLFIAGMTAVTLTSGTGIFYT